MRRYYFLIAAVVVALDQASKAAVAHTLNAESVITVIPGVFNIVFTRNPGVAFGIFAESSSAWKTAALILFSGAVICAVATALVAERAHRLTAQGVALSLILGGAVGNLIDRAFAGSVVDFLDFYYGAHHWHTFNLADSAIVVGALIWAATLWMAPRP